MSRIGKKPISIPNGLEVKIDGSSLKFKKSNNEKELDLKGHVDVKIEDGKIEFSPKGEDRQSRAYWGTYRALANNIVLGLTEGFSKQLEINGVGYRAAKQGKNLNLSLGFSHPVIVEPPAGITLDAPSATSIVVSGIDKEAVGAIAAKIRSYRLPEPYKGKGIKYEGEHIRRKVGKAGAKAKK